MGKDIFRERERGEEEAYFRHKDAELIAKLRQKTKLSEIAHALAGKLQTDEPALLDRIRMLGVTLDTGSAFILAPLVEVAWVDGSVSDAERNYPAHRGATRCRERVLRLSTANRLVDAPPLRRSFPDGLGSDPNRPLRPSAGRITPTHRDHDQSVRGCGTSWGLGSRTALVG